MFRTQEVQVQEETFARDILKNELSVGAFNLVVFGALDVAYERILNPHSSWAIEAFILALNRDSEDIDEAYTRQASLTGKYKYFFGDRTAWGFYVNGLAMISSGEYETGTTFGPADEVRVQTDNYTDLALGFGLGGKFVSRQGFFLDLGTGIGRNLLSNNSPTIVGQFNVNLGFRF
ncbi:hypothetical protein LZ575_02635 [Antarcticibacterium sp. 1MA-6-2]|uniref:hypothetical protein n=1 Tax=Antarcticibacterium sp. 1MA-6-2 TaxID=2908210 RepID=UPI001F397E5E|nr:hypothetical protein [Antarcticibacterium sp. 1MA-6-2]UJH91619.1 hypothetical protein LZ575_02635 [Antarcticibacterium sp. 1MA-6-2]